MASLRNKKVVQPVEIEPSALDQDAGTPQPALEATVKLIQDEIADLRRAEERYGEPDAVETADDRRQAFAQSNLLAQKHAASLNEIHKQAIQAGLLDASPSYFEYMQNHLRELDAPSAAANRIVADMQQHKPAPAKQEAAPDLSPRYVSAPVSRNNPGLSGARRGSINLSPAQRESAKIAGISETEYARQLERFNEMYDNGMIQR